MLWWLAGGDRKLRKEEKLSSIQLQSSLYLWTTPAFVFRFYEDYCLLDCDNIFYGRSLAMLVNKIHAWLNTLCPEVGGSRFLWNTSNHLLDYMVSHPIAEDSIFFISPFLGDTSATNCMAEQCDDRSSWYSRHKSGQVHSSPSCCSCNMRSMSSIWNRIKL